MASSSDESRDRRAVECECEGCDEAEEGRSIESAFAPEGRVLSTITLSSRDTRFVSEFDKLMKRSEISGILTKRNPISAEPRLSKQ
jgi:hypothetical protein